MAQSVAGKVIFEGFGTIGMSYPGGDIPSGFEAEIDMSYSFGVTAGFGVMDSLLVFGGAEYAAKPLKISSSAFDVTYVYNFIDFTAGIRYYLNGLYGDLGFFYGMTQGDVKVLLDDEDTGNLPDEYINNDYGILLGAGYILQINEQVGIDLGLRVKYGFAKVYEFSTQNLTTSTYDLKIGATYSL
jgi:hypothetical protein